MKKVLLIAFLLLSACSPSFSTNTPNLPPVATNALMPATQSVPTNIFATNQRLRRTVNLGNALEAPNEGEWGVVLQEDYFQQIAEAGFTAVRIPIRFSAHAAENPPYALEPLFMQRVDWAVQNATSRGLVAIVDMHHYLEMFEDPAAQRERFIALWKQIAEHFQDTPDDQVYFELLNEPNGALTNSIWNNILAETVTVVRQSNPTRPIIVGPSNWNSFDQMENLRLPEDPNLIVTFHYYQPFEFTHQGAEWVEGMDKYLGTTWDGTPDQTAAIARDFDSVAAWAAQNNRPVLLGEFGAYSRANQAARVRWTTAVRKTAEEHSFSWAYWEFCSGFGVYDPLARQWHADLLHALIPAP
jgi:endoglucanase